MKLSGVAIMLFRCVHDVFTRLLSPCASLTSKGMLEGVMLLHSRPCRRLLSAVASNSNPHGTRRSEQNKQLGLSKKLHSYLVEKSVRHTPAQKALFDATEQTFSDNWAVLRMASPPDHGSFLQMLIKLMGAKRVIEVGVFTGVTTLAMALAVPSDGLVVGCDVSAKYAAIGQPHWRNAGVEEKIDLRIAPALETLEELLKNQPASFDMGFIDADKGNYFKYYELLLGLMKPGGAIVVDNTLWSGHVIDEHVKDKKTKAIRQMNDFIATDERVDVCMVPVSDGVTIARKR